MKEAVADIQNELREETQKMIEQVKGFQSLKEEVLNTAPGPDKWSVLQCIAHINLYSDFYLKEFEKQIVSSNKPAEPFHQSRWFGRYSYENMKPENGKVPKPMQTFKAMNPKQSEVSIMELDRFVKQQELFLSLLKKSSQVSYRKTKCNLTLPLLKFTLGDTLRFYVYHNMRHIFQAQNVLKGVQITA